jgi:predicted RND superfamily exporter protein
MRLFGLRPAQGSAWGLDRLSQRAIDRPRTTILFFVSLVLLAAPGLLRLQLRTDGHALVPAGDPAIRFDAEVRQRFGLRDPIVVVIETSRPDGIFNAATLRRLHDLSATLAELDGVGPEWLTSLATERRDRVYPGTLEFRPFLDPIPDTPLYMDLFRGDLEAIKILHGTLVSNDFSAVAILVGAPAAGEAGGRESADRVDLYRRVVEVSRRFATPNEHISVVGAPVAEALLGIHILEDLRLLLPLSIATISLMIWLGCGRLWGVLIGMFEVAAGQVFTFGLMGWLGAPIYLTTAMLPVILTALGLADEIHLFWRYQRLLESPEAAEREHPATVRTLMRQMSRPLALTSLTTVIGFFSFLSSPLAPVRSFGAFTAAGLLFCMFWSLSVGPATLALLPPGALRRPARRSFSAPGELLRRWLEPALRQPKRTFAAIAVATAVIGVGAFRLEVQDSWIGGFAPRSPFRLATDDVNRLFHGTHLLLIQLDLSDWRRPLPTGLNGPPGPFLDPELLRAVGRFEGVLARQPEVGGVLGPFSHLTTVSFLRHARNPKELRIPDTAQEVEKILGWFDQARGERRRREVIDDARRRGVVTVFLKNANYRQVQELMAVARGEAQQQLAPFGARIGFAGDVAVSQAMIPAIVRTQVSSLLLAPLGSLLVVAFLCRSLRTGVVVSLPALLAIAWVFGMMGWLGIPLGVATSMFCAITLGVGVDYGIHLYECFERLRAEGRREGAALAACMEAGPAIVADTVAIALGFGILALSQVPANARLGLLVAVALVVSSFLTLTGLGTLLARFDD